MDSAQGYVGITPRGFPHSEIPGSTLVCSSPRLIAAYHVLHRLLVPRHPPSALTSLTTNLIARSEERAIKMAVKPSLLAIDSLSIEFASSSPSFRWRARCFLTSPFHRPGRGQDACEEARTRCRPHARGSAAELGRVQRHAPSAHSHFVHLFGYQRLQ